MHRRVTSLAVGCVVAGSIVALARAQSTPSPAQTAFDKDIKPILEKNCLSCHGETMQGRLDLRTRESALKGGARGADVVPGKPEDSRLYRRIAGLERPSMPAQADALPADEV